MNYPHRVSIERRDAVDSTDGIVRTATTTVATNVACSFHERQPDHAPDGYPSTQAVLVRAQAVLRLPLTLPDLPEDGHALPDYTFRVLSPRIGFVKTDGGAWVIESKRTQRDHVEYVLKR